jgi:hypothetical protein
MTAQRDGIALLAVVLALVVLEAAIAGALFLATLEVTSTHTLVARARTVLAAESAVAAALAAWNADAMAAIAVRDTVAAPVTGTLDGAAMHARIEHVRAGAYLVSGTGTVHAPAALAGAGAAALVRWSAPAAFAAAMPAALAAGGTVTLHTGGLIDGSGAATTCPPADSVAHVTFAPAAGIAAPHAGAAHIAVGASLAGAPPLLVAPAATDSAAFARLGPYDIVRLAGRADRIEAGTLSLVPATRPGPSGAPCDTAAPGNWGAPGAAGHPCVDYIPLVLAPGDLTIAGGSGQALLIVNGDLTIASGAALHGLADVLGDATVHGRVHGALRVRGNADIHGEIHRNACALWRALTRPTALARPHRSTARWRLPAF